MKKEITIKQLLDKYLEGQTSLSEEKILSEYFNSEEVKPEWTAYKSMFSFFQISKEEQSTKPFKPKTVPFWRSYHKIAAVLMVCFATTLFVKTQQPQEDLGTFDDPELAFEETVKIFDLIGDKINSGKQEIIHLNTLQTTKTQIIDKIKP